MRHEVFTSAEVIFRYNTLKMEAIDSSETLVIIYMTARVAIQNITNYNNIDTLVKTFVVLKF